MGASTASDPTGQTIKHVTYGVVRLRGVKVVH